jgi:hypothetical protein
MRQSAVSLARLCLFVVLAGCSVDVSGLRAPTKHDAARSPETGGDSGGIADAGLDEGRSTDVPVPGQDVQAGDGVDDGTARGDDAHPAVADSGEADRAGDAIEGGSDAADGPAAAPEVAAADVSDLGTDRHETGGKDAGDAGCLDNDRVPFIVPSFPAAMKCNLDGSTVEMSWTDLSTWEPNLDSRRCGSAGAYYIEGDIVGFQRELQVRAEVYAAEDSTWYAISGGPLVQPDTTGGFNGYFCLPQKGLERTFRFRIVKPNASQDAGLACLIHVR